MGKLAGKWQGGHDKGSSPAPKQEGYGGRGTMPFANLTRVKNRKDIIGGGLEPMPHGYTGRVLNSSKNKRIGRQEGTGPQS